MDCLRHIFITTKTTMTTTTTTTTRSHFLTQVLEATAAPPPPPPDLGSVDLRQKLHLQLQSGAHERWYDGPPGTFYNQAARDIHDEHGQAGDNGSISETASICLTSPLSTN